MMPLWKLKREWKRTKYKLALPLLRWQYPRSMRRYDQNKNSQIIITQGKANKIGNVALLLLFQPEGISESTLFSCKALRDAGFSILAVSNAKLSQSDLEKLGQYCFEIMQRPNFGYDFGGYRDGILHLLNSNHSLEKLLVLNDSCWFPTILHDAFLPAVISTKHDLFGAVIYQTEKPKPRFHILSYAFSFGKLAIQSHFFRTFWEDLVIASDYYWTIYNCERRMAPFFSNHGFSVGSQWSNSQIERVMKELSNEELEDIVDYEIRKDTKHKISLINLLKREPHDGIWRDSVVKFWRMGYFNDQFYLFHPTLLMKLGYSFMKKRKEHRYQDQRRVFLKLFGEAIPGIIRKEMEQHDSRRQM